MGTRATCHIRRVAGIFLSVHALACAGAADEAPDGSSAQTPVVGVEVETPNFMPYGTIVPEGESITAPPEPYDAERHGPEALPLDPAESLADRIEFRDAPMVEARRRLLDERLAQPPEGVWPGDGDAGWEIWWGDGVFALSDVQTDLTIPNSAVGPDGTFIYAPTHMPNRNSCLEMVTVHQRLSTSSSTEHYFGFWNHCLTPAPGRFAVLMRMDSTWRSKYARTFGDELVYGSYIDHEGLGGCWQGRLFNFSRGVWERWVNTCGSSSISGGWTAWESWNLPSGVCPGFPNIGSDAVFIRNGSQDWISLPRGSAEGMKFQKCFAGSSADYALDTTFGLFTTWEAITQ